MTTKKRLPTGVDSFERIITGDYLYIDKTRFIYDLITTKDYCFFTRPRRFGKSLLLSTLEELFKGNKNLFKGLWIEKDTDYHWTKHPVIRLDMSRIDCSSAQELRNSLCRALDIIGEEQNIDLSQDKSPVGKLTYLVTQLAKKEKVVVLIDEYDYAIVNNLHTYKSKEAQSLVAENLQVLHDFYIGLKSASSDIRFLFITGVGRFSRTSLFSAFNNLNDLSLLPSSAALAGCTEEEIQFFFEPYIAEMAHNRALSPNAILDEMRTWYNGYHFSESRVSVYNPYSVLYYFQNQRCSNYWFKTGTPTFLINVIKNTIEKERSFVSLDKLNHSSVSERTLESSSVDNINIESLLYQTGYLTIESFDPASNRYTLTFPNLEVESSLSGDLLGVYVNKNYETISSIMADMRAALLTKNLTSFTSNLESLFTEIPYEIHLKHESYYHSVFKIVSKLLGFDVQSEVSVATGRIDMVITMPHLIYVIEFKINATAEKALQQIKNNQYAGRYQLSKKEVILAGFNFEVAKNRFKITYLSETVYP